MKHLVLVLLFACLVTHLSAWADTSSSEGDPAMTERTGAVTFKGNPLTLLGTELKTGVTAPDFTLLGNDLAPVKLADTKGVRVFTSVPSLDTPVCDAQVRRFNEEVAKFPNVTVYAVSADLPFAQARWCGGAGIKNIKTLSDHRDMGFASAWGLQIKELRLLARAVFVVDSAGKITYAQVVKEVTDSPDFEKALAAIKEAK